MTNGGTSLSLSPPNLNPTRRPPDPSVTIDFQEQAWQQLIARAAPRDKLPSLIETIFSGKTDVVDRLRESDAQAFIDMMDEVCHYSLFLMDG